MWKQSAAILLFSALVLVGCNTNKAIEPTRTETPMEDVNRHVNTGATDDGITNDGVNNAVNNGVTDVERGVNKGVNAVERGVNDVTGTVEEGVNNMTPGTSKRTTDNTVIDNTVGNGHYIPHDRDDNK
ncbi:hypothetical protein [Rummeliibacillus pycnus]|uniref:hypothetical protein n=1 Tax=Rummeliibacillus pycnus TaxID=101070 RepID=UPI000C9996FF|nr:hypothetical protein [Rummeliibacillus pycnus]